MPDPITCGWCDRPATTEVELRPAGETTLPGTTDKAFRPSKHVPACVEHAEPEPRRDPPRRKKGPIEGQTDIFDMLKDQAA